MTQNHHQSELDRILAELENYFREVAVECPYGMSKVAIYRQVRFSGMPDRLMGVLLDAGFRRNGNCMYTMACPDCRACVPIRLQTFEYRANRNQKRAAQKNSDLEIEIAPLEMSKENLDLLGKFLQGRYPARESTAEGYYAGFFLNSYGFSMEVRYRLQGRLLGVAIVDFAAEWLNAVHFFFDPDEAQRSLGVFNIQALNNFCLEHKIGALYLGYWIDQVPSMQYKSAFQPHYLLIDGEWRRVSR